MRMDTTPSKSKILPLTSIRFFAALYVVLYHSLVDIAPVYRLHGALARISELGYVSVSFFFLLSGFILAVVYLKDGHAVDARKFYIARIARVYPLYLAAMLLDVPRFLFIGRTAYHRSWADIFAALVGTAALVQAWFLKARGINKPGWSLSAEAFFYLLFPFIGAAIWRMRAKILWPFAVLLYCGGTLVVKLISESTATLDRKSERPTEHLYIFVLGMCLARLFVWISADESRTIVLQRLAPWMLLIAAIGFLAPAIFDVQPSVMLLQHGIQAPIFALVLLATASGQPTIARALSVRWLVILGEASFALYLLHVPLSTFLRHVVDVSTLAGFLLYLTVTIGLSVVSIYWLEIPARRWILRRFHVRSAETLVTSSLAQ
jgi:peptidoglycan/LPS O-acetylase OafA/YrhL